MAYNIVLCQLIMAAGHGKIFEKDCSEEITRKELKRKVMNDG